MNTVKAEEIFVRTFGKHPGPRCAGIVEVGSGKECHDVGLFMQEISGTATDEQLEVWIKEMAGEVSAFERRIVDEVVKTYPTVDRQKVLIVRRMDPQVKRVRNEHGEMAWRVGARSGTRVEPYPKADPRSHRARAIAAAKAEEAAAAERELTRSELLEQMP